ncbi:hypothetical protein LIA77_06476 [Sarocladium implicatum]|nr:hypothetical protein LIA77_06476 [Sarocladium implicatum]
MNPTLPSCTTVICHGGGLEMLQGEEPDKDPSGSTPAGSWTSSPFQDIMMLDLGDPSPLHCSYPHAGVHQGE